MDSEQNDLIRRRAYAIWEREGRPDGCHEDHWRRARNEMHGLEDAPASAGTQSAHVAPAGAKAGQARGASK